MSLRTLFSIRRSVLALFVLPLLLGGTVFEARAQQNQILRRSKSIFLLPEFSPAQIRQSFGRIAVDTVNIYLKDATLVYKKNGKIMRAYLNNIYGVKFNDSLNYMRVDSALARIVAQKGYNYLLCKTSVDMKRYREEESGGTGMDHFEVEGLNYFEELNQDRRDSDIGLPLQDKYYFSIKGQIIPATEAEFKKVIGDDQKQAFKVLKENRFWSWRDPESLKMLLDFLPDEHGVVAPPSGKTIPSSGK